MQSARVKVLVGSNQESFEVPYDLLKQYSSAFGEILDLTVNGSSDQIDLPNVKKSTFGDFVIWVHTFQPCITLDRSIDCDSINSITDLAIFAETYRIFLLKNQASDVIRAALANDQWKVTPDIISSVYKAAPLGSTLRRLYFLGFITATNSKFIPSFWKTTFNDYPSLGFDYFRYKSTGEVDGVSIDSGGACRFHDHSDVSGWVLGYTKECPYPH